MNPAAFLAARMIGGHVLEDRPHQRDVPQVIDGEEARAQPIVYIVIVVGDIVRQRSNLSFQAGMGVKLQVVQGRE